MQSLLGWTDLPPTMAVESVSAAIVAGALTRLGLERARGYEIHITRLRPTVFRPAAEFPAYQPL